MRNLVRPDLISRDARQHSAIRQTSAFDFATDSVACRISEVAAGLVVSRGCRWQSNGSAWDLRHFIEVL